MELTLHTANVESAAVADFTNEEQEVLRDFKEEYRRLQDSAISRKETLGAPEWVGQQPAQHTPSQEDVAMKDIVSKATFGFVMAQLFPGAIALFALAFAYFAVETNQPNAVVASAASILKTWNDAPVAHQLFLLGCCIGTGMFIHGLHWSVLGALEHAGSVFDSHFHHQPIIVQVLGAPIRAVYEIGVLLLQPAEIREARMKEGATDINKDWMKQFEFVQDFYLYSAQFFAHTAYALLFTWVAVLTFVACHGFTCRRLFLLVLVYAITGVFFVLGRIQLASLFYAEFELKQRSAVVPGTPVLGGADAKPASDGGDEEDDER